MLVKSSSLMKIIVCDVCHEEGLTYYLSAGKQIDPSSGKKEDIYEPIDLCDKHAAKLLAKITSIVCYDYWSLVPKEWREKRKIQ